MRKILGVLLATGICNVFAANIDIKQGTDYTVITPPAKAIPITGSKVNVTEFYSYACIHCSLLEPKLDAWEKTAKNVDLNRIQVVWDGHFTGYAKINATSEAMHLGTNFNQAVFDATMNKRQNLEDPKQLQAFLAANSKIVDPKKFMATYNSFAISSKPTEYAQYTKAYNITGTPTFIVAGKYVTSPAQPDRLIQVIQALVDKAQAEQKSKK
jgi:thiol:disulfide interchange protein DsbA